MKEKQIWGKIVSKCWIDEKFKEKLMENPAAVFKENGLEVPAETKIAIHQDTENVKNWVVPLKPCEELVEEELGGGGMIVLDLNNRHDDDMC